MTVRQMATHYTRYNCTYEPTEGNLCDEGDFIVVSDTAKFLTLQRVTEGDESNFPHIHQLKIPKKESYAVTYWDDGDIQFYYNSTGIPYLFHPIS